MLSRIILYGFDAIGVFFVMGIAWAVIEGINEWFDPDYKRRRK